MTYWTFLSHKENKLNTCHRCSHGSQYGLHFIIYSYIWNVCRFIKFVMENTHRRRINVIILVIGVQPQWTHRIRPNCLNDSCLLIYHLTTFSPVPKSALVEQKNIVRQTAHMIHMYVVQHAVVLTQWLIVFHFPLAVFFECRIIHAQTTSSTSSRCLYTFAKQFIGWWSEGANLSLTVTTSRVAIRFFLHEVKGMTRTLVCL